MWYGQKKVWASTLLSTLPTSPQSLNILESKFDIKFTVSHFDIVRGAFELRQRQKHPYHIHNLDSRCLYIRIDIHIWPTYLPSSNQNFLFGKNMAPYILTIWIVFVLKSSSFSDHLHICNWHHFGGCFYCFDIVISISSFHKLTFLWWHDLYWLSSVGMNFFYDFKGEH